MARVLAFLSGAAAVHFRSDGAAKLLTEIKNENDAVCKKTLKELQTDIDTKQSVRVGSRIQQRHCLLMPRNVVQVINNNYNAN